MVLSKVSSGRYTSASEVVSEALRLFEEQERMKMLRLEELRREIDLGIRHMEDGKWIDADEFFDGLERRSSEEPSGNI